MVIERRRGEKKKGGRRQKELPKPGSRFFIWVYYLIKN
jgi:hypothetical protein